MNYKVLLFLFLLFSVSAEAAVVRYVRIKGNKKVEDQFIKPRLGIRSRGVYRDSLLKKDVKHLSSLGFFKSVQGHVNKVSKNKVDVIYIVKERPVIDSIEFVGNKHFSQKELKEHLKLQALDFVNFDRLSETLSAIEKEYKEDGYFLSKISYKIVPLKKSSKVKLLIKITEGDKILIKQINFIGNRAISSKKIKQYFLTKEKSILSLFTNSGVYDPEVFDRDIQMLNYIYRDKGYLQMHMEKPELSITPDKKQVYINITLNEGPRFRVGEQVFGEDSVVSEDEVIPNLKSRTEEYFSLSTLQQDIRFIEQLYKNKGYAFAAVDPRIVPDQVDEDKIHLLMQVKKGAVYKVGRVDVVGNHKTRDKVILREVRLVEGDQYNESQKQSTQALIQRLGFFESVDLKLKPVKGKKLDVLIDLKEREKIGEAHLAGGYNSFSKLFIKGGLKNSNFLGLGHALSVQLDISRFQELFNFNYTNPYFLDQPWSLSFDVFNMGQDMANGYGMFSNASSSQYISYSQLNTGFSFSLGRHFSKYLSGYMKYRLRNQSLSYESLHLIRKIPGLKNVFEFLFGQEEVSNKKQNNNLGFNSYGRGLGFTDIYSLEDAEGLNSSVSGIFEADGRNDRLRPSSGYYSRLSVEYSGLGGDFNYTKSQLALRYYKKIWKHFTLKQNFNLGLLFSADSSKLVPFTELFLLGGPHSLRGFRFRSVGERRYSKQAFEYANQKQLDQPEAFAWRPYGGSKMFYYNLELEFDLIKSMDLSAILFFDIGEARDELSFSLNEGLRMDAGLGFKWWSPFGPLRVDFGLPYKPRKEYGENSIEFQFNVGSAF